MQQRSRNNSNSSGSGASLIMQKKKNPKSKKNANRKKKECRWRRRTRREHELVRTSLTDEQKKNSTSPYFYLHELPTPQLVAELVPTSITRRQGM
jgi:hypothetical protein